MQSLWPIHAVAMLRYVLCRISAAAEVYDSLLAVEGMDNPLAYVQYMRFARRAQGVNAARSIFSRARKAGKDTHHVYMAMAKIELFLNKEPKIAVNIFEAGYKKHASEPRFVQGFIDMLYFANDEDNLRQLFERVISSMATAPGGVPRGIEVWNQFLQFEHLFGVRPVCAPVP